MQNARACFRILFVLGEPDQMIANVTSDRICFYNNFSLSLQEQYTRTATTNQAFKSPIKAIVLI